MGVLRYLTITVLLFCALTLQAQVPTEKLENEIESLAEGNEENELDLIQLAENLALLQANPVEVNFATSEELSQIPYLDVFQIANLLRYRQESGKLYGAFELSVIKGFDETTIAQVSPYLSFATQTSRPSLKLKNVYQYSRHNLLARSIVDFEQRQGFSKETSNPYLGTPGNHYLRYRGQYKNLLSAGFTAQQDAGEPWGRPTQNLGVDFLSGHLALQNYGALKTLIVGDFNAEFGQGLALWSSLAFGKGAQTTNVRRYGRGFRPFTGAEENRFMRGIATTWQIAGLQISAFASRNNIDASTNDLDTNLQALNVSSLPTTGLHRTQTELNNKDQNTLQTLGGNLSYTYRQLKVGATVVNYQLALPISPARQLYQKFRFSGDQLTNASLDFNYLYKDLNLFGEVAFDEAGNSAQTLGLQSQPADGFEVTVLLRNMAKEYRFLYIAPFAESGANGERGAYLGWQWQLSKNWLLNSYADFYRFTWPRFRTDAPSRGQCH